MAPAVPWVQTLGLFLSDHVPVLLEWEVGVDYPQGPLWRLRPEIRGLEEDLWLEELQWAVGTVAHCRALVPEVLLVECYQTVAGILLPCLLETIQESRRMGSFLQSMREAQIVMLPKLGRDLVDPCSYWPLSMLGMDTKILAKAMAMHLRCVVTHLVHEDQWGFMLRDTHMNLQRLSHALHLMAGMDTWVAAVTLDIGKAFATLSLEYL
ncbi:hypothetical protein NDU88_005734 [Pleurodeles waltl]|uniref:Reverse transcriptase domain-containing protein n=1 Tax=Pleurodeles waltl TaxID=8319 RepID=A0AAV7NRE4_PLEWA|nr:hypothetical protein NDU88_005734 [Pleurodeles waltl]